MSGSRTLGEQALGGMYEGAQDAAVLKLPCAPDTQVSEGGCCSLCCLPDSHALQQALHRSLKWCFCAPVGVSPQSISL